MTTGRDESGRRGPDLLAGVPAEPPPPGIDPAAFEEVRAWMLDIRERLTALEASPERPEPLTREDLAAWEEGFLARLGAMVSGEADAAAESIAKSVERSVTEAGGLEERRERVAIRDGVSGIGKTLERVEAKVDASDGTAVRYLEGIASRLREVGTALDRMRRGRWIVPGLCMTITGLAVAAGMALESRIHIFRSLLPDG